MFDRHIDTTRPADAGHEAASFRARLMARRNSRPQSTLAIDNGIVYQPGSATSEHARRAAEAVRDEIRRRRPEPVAAAPVPAAVQKAPPAKAPSDAELVSVIEEVAARKAEDEARRTPAAVVLPAAAKARQAERRKAAPEKRAAVAEAEEQVDVSTRIGDISQLAFAGLAVLGLAGLSVMAAENALKGADKDKTDATGEDAQGTTETGALAPALKTSELKTGGASAAALAAAQPEAPKAWFNYQGVADALAARKAELEAAERAAKVEAEKEARLRAASAIADAEAARVAEQQQAAAEAAAEARLAEAAERQRLADVEAARVAALEAERQAQREAERRAAAEEEALRLAELEAKKKAEADAEALRVAELDAQRLARLEAQRKAAEEAARQEAFEQAKATEARRLRLAALTAQQEADAAELRRLEAAAAKTKADRLAAEKLLAEQQAAAKTAPKAARLQKASAELAPAPAPSAKPAAKPVAAAAPTPQKIVFTPYEGPVPQPASYKPAKPYIQAVSAVPDAPVVRQAPATLRANTASVRSFDTRTPEGFLASRADRTATAPMTTDDLDMVKAAFRSILDKGADGSKQAIMTADGRALTILIERTVTREMGQSTVRTVTYTPSPDAVARVVTEQVPVTVSVMCRDISYGFAGQEHGRFAACLSPDGAWTMARATDVVEVTTASLPNSAG